MGCPPASKVGSLAVLLLFSSPQAHSVHRLVYGGPGHSQPLRVPGTQRRQVGCTRTCLPKKAEWRSPPSADGSFFFLRRAQEATELLPEDLLQVRRGLGRQTCACLCPGVGTCPLLPAIFLASMSNSQGWDLPTCRRTTPGPWH